ncbi:hypothetical protein BMI87_13520 [Thioclava sp. F28-4]|nr:hypothetical protein BMI87_13520 [Thioclava sp. F28-4]
MMMSYRGTELSERFPANKIPASAQRIFKCELTRYQSWRRRILDLQFLSSGEVVDTDPIVALQRLARLEISEWAINPFYVLRKIIPDGVNPGQIDRDLAIQINARLSGGERMYFRSACRVLDRLQGSTLAKGTGLLPDETIGPLPRAKDHRANAPMPERLEQEYQDAPASVRMALAFVYRVAVLCELCEASANISPKELLTEQTLKALRGIEPAELGFDRPSKKTLEDYLNRLIRHFSIPDVGRSQYAETAEAKAWSEFRRELSNRDMTSLKSRIETVSKLAISHGLAPHELTPAWFARTCISLEGYIVAHFRTGAFAIDALFEHEDFPRELLPEQPSGFVKHMPAHREKDKSAAVAKSARRADPVLGRWASFFEKLRQVGFTENELNMLSAVRAVAVNRGIPPRTVDRDFLIELLDTVPTRQRARVHGAARAMDRAAGFIELATYRPEELVGPLPDGRSSFEELPAGLSTELDQLVARIGYGDSTKRSVKAAAKALFRSSAANGLSRTPSVAELLSRDFGTLASSSKTQAQAPRYERTLIALRDFIDLPWTESWRQLYAAAKDAGCAPARNPVPCLMEYAGDRSPEQLNVHWVQSVERKLRRPNELSVHGRADLAKTFLANVQRLEDLRSQPGFRGGPLLSEARLLPR